ncbi:hypothetical protein [Gordonia alkanivorans]|uniref:hypothetical protein n=1 Tax=Gordonia alkanivorans TaxID=84096 RepID=UPI00244D2992|nr:hypothetical protein [Gordonia alkanivorans]MDH3010664.1 hypothetical protein [Gordonia alkanivorans]MDH3015381.1 hypothetical protein [Gordonia alkanivorans]MDH3040472.1 hypothetical protein [Gordonia alkanivorans]
MTDNKNARKNLDELLAEAEARVADLKAKQRQKDAREATKIGKRLYSKIGDGRAAFTAEFKAIRDELFVEDEGPADGPAATQEPPAPVSAGFGETAWGGDGYGQ